MSQSPEEIALERIREAAESGANELDLSGLSLESLPHEVWQLQNLIQLNLGGNQLASLPPEIVQLQNLTTLYLRNIKLASLSPEIDQLQNLTQLNLSDNQLASLPPEIAQLQNLTTLDLSNNQLASLPPEIGQLQNLTQLNLSDNKLASLPNEIIQLQNLTQLVLSSNGLASLPNEIGQLQNLTQLVLFNNKLSSLPNEIGQLQNLTQLVLSSNGFTSLPPKIGQLQSLTYLDLSSNKLASLPPEICQLQDLTELVLSSNGLASLPPEICQLQNLTQLNLSDNKLASLPNEIIQLQNLTELVLSSNGLASLPPEICQLQNLTKLYIGYNQLASLPPEICQLQNLTSLSLSSNGLASLPPEICQLQSLTSLSLRNNKLASLPPEIVQLQNLTELDLSSNQLASLPLEIGQLQNLTQLELTSNGLTSLPPEIGQLQDLTQLVLFNNKLSSLPNEIGQLTALTSIYLFNNKLASLPPEIGNLHKLENINLRGNPLEIAIPTKWLGDAFGNNSQAQKILAYYKQMHEEGGRPLGEARILVVGEGGVGKTSIAKSLLGKDFNAKEDTTLIVEKHPLPLGEVRAQLWDFGGQEHMHATHQFFFSGRSLYLLVFDNRGNLEQNKIEYWLTLINTYSKNSPVILVGNKCDQHEMDIEKRKLKEKYPNICGFVSTSASTGEHIEELRQKIQEEVRAMPQVRVLFSANYLAVKEELEIISEPNISHREFVKVCERHGILDSNDQDTVLDLLHDLGTVLYFRDNENNPLLPALGVLNPNWVTRGVYLIITDPLLKDKHKGRLSKTYLREILSTPEYSRHIEDIMKLLERFELCYQTDNSSYWFPSLMEKDEPAGLGDWSSTMKFTYTYPELPKSVIVRFIVKTHKFIYEDQVWRYGVVIKIEGNTAVIRADEKDKTISIFIAGEEATRRDALAIIRAQFDDIHSIFVNPPEASIYPPQYPNVRLSFHKMKNHLKTGTTEIPEMDGDKPITIKLRELLDGFVTPEERRKDEERDQKESGRRGDTYNIYNTVNVHGNVQGGAVTAGEGNTSNITMQNSFNTFPPELQTSLLELIKASETLLQIVHDAEQKEEIKNELEDLQKEANKSKPKKDKVKLSVDGLAQAAKNLNEIGKPVLELATTVIKLINNLP